MWDWRKRGATTSAGLGLILLAAGCGNADRALTLPQVREAMNAAGLKHLHVLTYNSTVATVSGKMLPSVAIKIKGQPDWLQDRKRPGLLFVRIPKVGEAKRIVSDSRMERGGGFTIRTDRVCNVLVVNYLAKAPTYSSLASRAEGELRRRCG